VKREDCRYRQVTGGCPSKSDFQLPAKAVMCSKSLNPFSASKSWR
jgi:hypothetical protein